MSGGPERQGQPTPVDIAIAVAVLTASIVNLAAQDAVGIAAIPGAGFLLLTVASVALVWRRRWSLPVLGVVLAMATIWAVSGLPGNPVFHVLVSLYAVGRHVPVRSSVAGLTVALVLVGVVQATDGDTVPEVVTAVVVTALPWYLGRLIRTRRYLAAAARERAEQLEWRRAREAERAVADARSAIARELHDVVAHNVSVMTVQAGVARLLLAEDTDRAREAIAAVEQAGRRALDELRHLLGVLRPQAATDELSPQPAVHQLPELVEQLRRTGMRIELSVEASSALPVRVELFAYRIVQEALTNVLKHGGIDASAHVRVEEADGALRIEVTDTGSGRSTMTGAGQGIVGMKERAALLGGSVEAGPRPQGGFRVVARLPRGDT